MVDDDIKPLDAHEPPQTSSARGRAAADHRSGGQCGHLFWTSIGTLERKSRYLYTSGWQGTTSQRLKSGRPKLVMILPPAKQIERSRVPDQRRLIEMTLSSCQDEDREWPPGE